MKLLWILTATLLLLLNLMLIIITLSLKTWSEINTKDVMALATCTDCDKLYTNWNFECFARSICSQDSDLGLCQVYKNLYSAGFGFMVLEVASLLMGILMLEKIAILAVHGEFGSSWNFYINGILILVFHLIGICIWIGKSGAKWTGCDKTNNIYSTPDICALDGPRLSIANIFLISLTLSYIFYLYRKHPVLHIGHTVSFKKIFWIPGKIWAYIVFALLGLSYILIMASTTTNLWISKVSRRGGLLRCENCDDVDDLGWQCLSGRECEIDSESADCDLYHSLSKGSQSYLILQGITVIFLILFAQSLTASIKGRKYGLPILNFIYPIAAMFCNMLATAVWFGITEAKFSDCDLCAENGPGLAVASQFFTIPMAGIFTVIYWRRDEIADENKLDTSMAEKVVDLTLGNIMFPNSPMKENSFNEENKVDNA
ncbi:hypothetical protein SteCoe_13220 [Stentor coeruleus]|uniref:Uncharacterized protein n=1 Tax=Stentor coeruleus TaxID=5963 RepID=A0A1R2C919_9CILI|nr:hypothetical protein SteCoe_13220 [Stentor coeruleus]